MANREQLQRDAQPQNTFPGEEERLPEFLTTEEVARFIRKSVSYVLRIPDLPFLPGKPNTYALADVRAWFERNKHRPRY